MPSAPIFSNNTSGGQSDNNHENNSIQLNNSAPVIGDNNFQKDSQASTSNDDSLDSTSSKRRRKRKPSKTTRMSNNESDEPYRSNKRLCPDDIDSNDGVSFDLMPQHLQPPQQRNAIISVDGGSKDERDATQPILETESSKVTQVPSPIPMETVRQIDPPLPNHIPTETQKESLNPAGDPLSIPEKEISFSPTSPSPPLPPPPPPPLLPPLPPPPPPPLPPQQQHILISPASPPNSAPIDANSEKPENPPMALPTPTCDEVDSIETIDKSKADQDDCETIDKIAAMIASTSSEYNPEIENSLPSNKNESSISVKCQSSPIDETTSLKEILDIDKPDQKDHSFEEVENKLEEMFAGIEDDRPFAISTESATKPTDDNIIKIPYDSDSIKDDEKSVSTVTKKPVAAAASINKPTIKKKIVRKTSGGGGGGKKGIKTNSKNSSKHGNGKAKFKTKDDTAATSSLTADAGQNVQKYKGPFVQVKADGSSTVVNTPITEEIAEQKSKMKKSFANSCTNDRSKIRGLHVSTLSMKYDADTTDKTWICVFCKMGPHKYGLGDLFGPYIMTTTCDEYQLSQIDPKDDEFKSKRTKVDMIQKRGLPVVAAAVGGPSTSSCSGSNIGASNVSCTFFICFC